MDKDVENSMRRVVGVQKSGAIPSWLLSLHRQTCEVWENLEQDKLPDNVKMSSLDKAPKKRVLKKGDYIQIFNDGCTWTWMLRAGNHIELDHRKRFKTKEEVLYDVKDRFGVNIPVKELIFGFRPKWVKVENPFKE